MVMFDLVDVHTSFQTHPDSFWSKDYYETEYAQRLMRNVDEIYDSSNFDTLMKYICPPPGISTDVSDEWIEIVCVFCNCIKEKTMKIASAQDKEECRQAVERCLFICRLHLARIETDLGQELKPALLRQIQVLVKCFTDLLPSISVLYDNLPQTRRTRLAMLYAEPLLKFMFIKDLTTDAAFSSNVSRFIAVSSVQQGLHTILEEQLGYLLANYEHVPKIVAQILIIMNNDLDDKEVSESLLTNLAEKAAGWTDAQNTAIVRQAKTTASLLRFLSAECPVLLAYNLGAVTEFLVSGVAQLRQAVVEIAPQVITAILDRGGELEEAGPLSFKTAIEFLRIMTQRARDTNHFVRMRAVASVTALCDHKALIKERLNFAELAVTKTADRTQLVRRQAMRLMKKLIATHPPIMHANNLSSKVWTKTLCEIEEIMPELHGEDLSSALQAVIRARDAQNEQTEGDASQSMLEIESENGNTNTNTNTNANGNANTNGDSSIASILPHNASREEQLRAAHTFVVFTLQFIDKINLSLKVVQTLLSSRSKFDNMDAIDLLVYAEAYNVESSAPGIRAIMHLVWAKADNDDGNSVAKAAVDCYKSLFMTASPDLGVKDQAKIIADNLIRLASTSTMSERMSLERLLELAVQNDYITPEVVGRLWKLYQTPVNIDKERRTFSALVLSMMARADSSIARCGVSNISEIGLNTQSFPIDFELAQYSCSVLRYAVDTAKPSLRLPPSFDLFDNMVTFLTLPATAKTSMQWVRMAKEALAAISALCDSPPVVFSKLMRQYIDLVFRGGATANREQLYAQSVFLAGEVALHTLAFLERSELEFKRRIQTSKKTQVLEKESSNRRNTNANANKSNNNNNASNGNGNGNGNNNGNDNDNEDDDDQDEIMGGSNEDDFLDTIEALREECMLYSDKALLRPFALAVASVCENINDKIPTNSSTELESNAEPINLMLFSFMQTLTKFMCVSNKYCSDHLKLAIDLMGHHSSSIVRSNFLLALSDVTISFNHLIDDHTEVLYNRLDDPDNTVKRTCIIALTFLILAGQIKVKGRLGELAKAMASSNRKIAKLATMFFRELATKDNALYNGFLDMLSFLINTNDLPEPDMVKILRFLCKFIDKERYISQLVSKVLLRLKRCASKRQFTAFATVLRSLAWKMDDETKEMLAAGFTNPQLSDDETGDSEDGVTDEEEGDTDDDNETSASEEEAEDVKNVSDSKEIVEAPLTDAVGDMSIE